MASMNFSPYTMNWRGKTGTFVETYRSKVGVSFDWKIPNILTILCTKNDYYTSPSLKFSDSIWYLSIYPKGKSTSKFITLELTRANVENSVCASVGVKTADGSEEEIIRQSVFTERQKSFVFSEFLSAIDLTNRRLQLVPSHSLTVTCTLWREALSSTPVGRMAAVCERWKEHETQVRLQERADIDKKSISVLRKQFKDLLSSGEDHDVTIQVRDSKFNVHKCILRARSTVFEAMFRHEMKESSDGSISIEDCDPEAFGKFLRYIYTAEVDDLSLGDATELYYAADKYDVSSLKEACLHFLRASLSVTAICDVITLAKNHGESKLLEEAIRFFVENTKEILSTEEWRCFVKTNPDEANDLYIRSFEMAREKQ